jgi:hypothetical protein
MISIDILSTSRKDPRAGRASSLLPVNLGSSPTMMERSFGTYRRSRFGQGWDVYQRVNDGGIDGKPDNVGMFYFGLSPTKTR